MSPALIMPIAPGPSKYGPVAPIYYTRLPQILFTARPLPRVEQSQAAVILPMPLAPASGYGFEFTTIHGAGIHLVPAPPRLAFSLKLPCERIAASNIGRSTSIPASRISNTVNPVLTPAVIKA